MKDKIIHITTSAITFSVKNITGEERQIVNILFGLGESGRLYQLNNNQWMPVTESPEFLVDKKIKV